MKLKNHLELLEILRLWQEYHHVPEVIAEMNRAESQIWNEARDYVLNRLKGKS